MNSSIEHLCRALSSLKRPLATPLEQLLLSTPQHDLGLSPWAVWTLICLVRHRQRQRWVADLIKFRLNADLGAIGDRGAFGHPDIPQTGLVPNDNAWQYYFHGRGCCLTHRVTGESIDVDFYDETADWFDSWFFIEYLKSLKNPPFPEERLTALHPSIEPLILSIDELHSKGLIGRMENRHVFRLHPDCDLLEQEVAGLDTLPADPNQRIMAWALLGDWQLAASELPADHPSMAALQQRATDSRAAQLTRLERWYGREDYRIYALRALADIAHPRLDRYVEAVLGGKPSGATSTVLKIIGETNDPKWCRLVFELFRRLDPEGEIPQPYLWQASARLLLKHAYMTEAVIGGFSRVKDKAAADIAIVALEHCPDQAKELFRRALRSTIPMERTAAAAGLAILDEGWCHDELKSVLDESDEQMPTADCRAALMASRNREMHRIVEEWERRNPHQPEKGPYISMEEVALQSRESYLQFQMEKLHDRVLPLRGRVR